MGLRDREYIMQRQTETRHTNLPGYGMILGTGIGTTIGIFAGQIALGAAFGSAIGLVVGAVADLLYNRR